MCIHITISGGFLDDAGEVHSRLAADGGRLERVPVAIVDQPNVHATVCELRRRAIRPNRRDHVAIPPQAGDQPPPEMPIGAGNENPFEHAGNDSKV